MFERYDDIYASQPMYRLRQEQMRSLSVDVQRCSGTHALSLDAAAGDDPPKAPLLGCWTTLHLRGDRYIGDVVAAANEPLPFSDDAFQLVLIQHLLEVVSMPAAVLTDALRILAPGGMLAIAGLHPISLWSPWFCWKGRGTVKRMKFPYALNATLHNAGMELERVARVGRSWPSRAPIGALVDNIFGGGYVLIARKRRHTMNRLQLGRIATPLASHGRLSAEIRRSAAQQNSMEYVTDDE